MKNIFNKIVQLGLWSDLDLQFSDMLLSTIINNDNIILSTQKKNALLLASACLSAHVNCGHTYLPLVSLSPDKLFQGQYPKLNYEIYKEIGTLLKTNDWQKLLFSLSAISDGSCAPTPLILDNKGLYLYRMWSDECTIAKFFNYKHQTNPFNKQSVIKILNKLFPITHSNVDWHKIATAIGITRHRVLISGGPGTGKTTTITKIVTALLSLDNNLHIKITAPTGRAAALLTESLINNIKISGSVHQSDYCHKLPRQATTLHSLFRLNLYQQNIQHNNLLDFSDLDVLIIDEASMVSLSMLAAIISVIPLTTKIMLFGDHHQLCSIKPGAVFKDICQFSKFHYSPEYRQELTDLTGYILPHPIQMKFNTYNNHITDGTCILKKNYRFTKYSGINKLSHAIHSGNYNQALSLLYSKTYTDIRYVHLKSKHDYIKMINDCAIKYYNYFKIVQYSKLFTKKILTIFNNYRILCALKNGPFGATLINYYIEQILYQNKLINLHDSNRHYVGKPIIILRNEPSLGLSNGDSGVLWLNSQNNLSAYFLSSTNTIKTIPLNHLPEYTTCFAITIHKAQGSEFQNISIILPNQHIPMLTRELLYTAITRTQHQLLLYSTDEVIIRSINLVTQRYSGLYDKINKNINL